MPAKGYVNMATSLKEGEAAILNSKLNGIGYKSLHAFLKALINQEATILTSKNQGITSKSQNLENPNLGPFKPNKPEIRWTGWDLNPRLPECKTRLNTEINWEMFRNWLKRDHAAENAAELFRIARRYYDVLIDPSRAVYLASLPKDSRRMATSSLSNLAKFLGIYDYWKSIIRNNGLKWQGRSTLDVIVNILNTDLGEVKTWLKEAIKELLKEHGTENSRLGVSGQGACFR